MSNKLKIYACSGVGQTPAKFTYWTDNTDTISNTQAVNNLLSMINELNARLLYLNPTKQETIDIVNHIDMLVLCLHAAELYQNDTTMLMRAGRLIAHYILSDVFNLNSLNDEERDKNLDSIISNFDNDINEKDYTDNSDFVSSWWQKNIISLNRVGLNKTQQEAAKDFFSGKGIGAINTDNINDMVLNSGSYYLYTYFTDEQAKKCSKDMQLRRAKQKETYNYTWSCFEGVFGDKEAYERQLRIGIYKDYKAQPETVVAGLMSGVKTVKSVGDPLAAEVIVAIIAAVVSILTTVLTLVLQYCATTKAARYSAPVDVESGIPGASDWDDVTYSQPKNKLLIYGIVAAIALMIFKKK